MLAKIFIGWMVLGALGSILLPVVLVALFPKAVIGVAAAVAVAYGIGTMLGSIGRPRGGRA